MRYHGALRRPQRGATSAAEGERACSWVDTDDIYAIGFDQLIPGNRGPTVNHLRLWSGRAITPFHIDAFNAGDYAAAVREQVEAKNLSRVLYPDDSTPQGKELRLKQQYFFVSASLQDILATHLSEGRSLASMPDAIAIQLNDTHPAVAIPELMRLLIDEHGMSLGGELEHHDAACFRTPITPCCPRRSRHGRWRCSSACCRGIWRSSI